MHTSPSAVSFQIIVRWCGRRAFGLALASLPCVPAHSATFNIADGDVAGLRNAINACNTNAQDDIINLATNGTYVFTDADPGTSGSAALPSIRRDGDHPDPFHDVTINGNNATLARSDAEGTPDFRLLSIPNGTGGDSALVTISNLTFTNGRLTAAGSYGGGVVTNGNVILNNCTISNNSAPYAGGIQNANGGLVMNNCTVNGNTATTGTGGGLWNGIASNRSATVTLVNCTLSGNTASSIGGTIYNQDVDQGGHGDSIITLHHCTISGGGIYNSGFNSVAKVFLGNTILSNCSLGSIANPGNGATKIFTEGYNMSTGSGDGYLTHSEDFTNTNPGLDPEGLKFNGGNTRTIALMAGAAAIDQGYWFGIGTDQRGLPRPVNNPVIPNNSDGSDIGAFESASDPTQSGVNGFIVTTLFDHNDGVAGAIDCSLREALQRTNLTPGADAIRFAPGLTGTITLQGAAGGQLSIANPVTIIGPGARLLSISGNTNYRIFSVTGPGSSTISGLTIKNGWAAGSSGQGADGGGIYNSASLALVDCTLDFNRAVGGSGATTGQAGGTGRGGAIFNAATLSLTGCTLKNNGASGGFGVNNPPPDDFTLTTGGAGGSAHGGAIFNHIGASLTISNCTFSANNAGAASAGSGHWGGNGGSGLGGAIYSLGTLSVTGSTVSGNSGFPGAGGAGRSAGFNGAPGLGAGGLVAVGSGTATVRNTISAGNSTTGTTRHDVYGTFISNGYNLIGRIEGGSGFNGIADQSGNTAAPLNAQLGPLADNGGFTDTFLLLPNSPAIDKGHRFGLTVDQRGRGRGNDFPNIPNAGGGDGSDIGALEKGGLIIVTTLDDHDDGAATPADTTLREAINAANNQTGEDETIAFAPGLTGTLQLISALPQIATSMTIAGPGADLLSISRDNSFNYRIFLVSNNTTSGPTVAISELTITNGHPGSGGFPQDCGGGVLSVYSTLTISDCVITGNSGPFYPATGGGIFNYGGTLTVNHSTVSGNNGFYGGGIGNHQPAAGTATVNLNGCTLSGNMTNGGDGGAIYNNAPVPGGSAVINLTNCTISGNQASGAFGGSGGAIYNIGTSGGSGNVSLTHCTLYNNTATSGGGISNITGSGSAIMSLRNCILSNGGTAPNIFNSGGIVSSEGFNLCNDAAGGDATTGPGGLLGASGDLRNTDPLLGALGDHGGPTRTHLPLVGSPALDGGKSFSVVLDQRGLPRIADSPYWPNAGVHPFASVTDTDGDGMADEWEAFYNTGNSKNDSDNDGRTNREEFAEGTNPQDSSSYLLRIIAIELIENDVKITFNGVANSTVRLERKISLTDLNWSNTGVEVTPAATATAQITHFGGVTDSTGFYRLRRMP